jgi:hypothetical protein
MTFLLELLKTLGTAAIVMAAVAWLTKSIITHVLSRNIEAYKSDLKRAADKEVEETKSKLQMVAMEHQIVFSRLHEKRAEIVAESYELIHELHSKAITLGGDIFHAGLRTPKDRANEVFDECFKFYEYFQRRRIFFGEEVCKVMDSFVELIAETNAALKRAPDNLDHSTEDGKDAYSKLAVLLDRLPEIRKVIENDFRTLLGVTPALQSGTEQIVGRERRERVSHQD